MPVQAELKSFSVWGIALISAFSLRYFGGNASALQPLVSASAPVFWSAFTVATGLVARYFAKGNPLPREVLNQDLSGKICLVTGPAAGLGLETATFFAVRGATVILGARSVKRNEEAAELIRARPEAKGKTLKFITKYAYDAEDLNSVKKFAEGILSDSASIPSIHILVLNAGLSDFKNVGQSKYQTYIDYTMCINFFAPVLLTEKLLSKLKEWDTRIVNLSSYASRMVPPHFVKDNGLLKLFQSLVSKDKSTPFTQSEVYKNNNPTVWQKYCTSKLANIYHSNYLVSRGLKASSLHPGSVATEFSASLHPLAAPACRVIGIFTFFKTQEEGAWTQIFASFNDDSANPLNKTASGNTYVNKEACFWGDCVRHNENYLMMNPEARDLDIADAIMKWTIEDVIAPFI